MGAFVWNDKLDVGVDHMNDEHRIIVDTMNKLVDLTQANRPIDEIKRASDALAEYAVGHFAREEEYLDKINYPGLKQHKEIHKKLLERFGRQKAEFDRDPQVHAPIFFKFLELWLFSHIHGIDKDYGKFSSRKKAG